MTLIFSSVAEALDHLYGFKEWEWGGSSSFEGLCEWAVKNASEETYLPQGLKDSENTWLNGIIRDYLKAVGENPSDYSL